VTRIDSGDTQATSKLICGTEFSYDPFFIGGLGRLDYPLMWTTPSCGKRKRKYCFIYLGASDTPRETSFYVDPFIIIFSGSFFVRAADQMTNIELCWAE